MKREQLVDAAKDLNNVLFDEDSTDKIDVNATDIMLRKQIREAALWLYATDEISDNTLEVLKTFEWKDSDFEKLDEEQDPVPAFYKFGILFEDNEETAVITEETADPDEETEEEPEIIEETPRVNKKKPAPPKEHLDKAPVPEKQPSAYGTALALMGPDPVLPIGDLYDLMKAQGFDIQVHGGSIKTAHSIFRKVVRILERNGWELKMPKKKK